MSPEPPRRLEPPPLARPLTAPPFRGRVLVIAPHPDDEALGPGGTLLLHRQLGDPADALFVTTGVNGDNRGRLPAAEYVALRRREALAAARVLGLRATEFWDYPDGMEITDADLRMVTERLAAHLKANPPDVIYAPHVHEQHVDHHFVGRAAQAAVQELQRAGRTPRLLGYEVWSALQPHWVVDVAAVYESKLAAIRCYASQLEANDMPRSVEALNRFRSVLLPPGGRYAEAFREIA